jgi:hypothetical protein
MGASEERACSRVACGYTRLGPTWGSMYASGNFPDEGVSREFLHFLSKGSLRVGGLSGLTKADGLLAAAEAFVPAAGSTFFGDVVAILFLFSLKYFAASSLESKLFHTASG